MRLTSLVGDEHEVTMDRLLVLGGRRQRHGRCTLGYFVIEYQSVLIHLPRYGWERLIPHVVIVAQVSHCLVDVVKGTRVAWMYILAMAGLLKEINLTRIVKKRA